LPLLGLQASAFLLYLWLRAAMLGSPSLGLIGGPPLGDRVLLSLGVIPVYLRLLFWPLALNPKHPFPPPASLMDADVLMGAVLLVALGVLALMWGRRVPGLRLGLAWLVLAWLPASNLIPIRGFVVAERYLYLPSAGFALALAGAVAGIATHGVRGRKALFGAVATLLLTLACLAAAQAGIWRDTQAFYEALVRRNPDSELAHNNLGAVYLGLGDEPRAGEEFREALRLQPGHAGALSNLGVLAQRRGDLAEARRLYQEALATRPDQAEVWNNLGTIHEAEGDLAQAARDYGKAIQLHPAAPRFLANLAGVLAAQGKREEAANLFEQAIRLDPTVSRWREALAVLQAGGKL
jgi:Flp pilus assembly protein TadD